MHMAYSHIVSYLSNLTRFGLRSLSYGDGGRAVGRSFSSHWHCAIKRYMKCAIIVRSRSANLLAQDVRHIIITVLVISYKTDTHTQSLTLILVIMRKLAQKKNYNSNKTEETREENIRKKLSRLNIEKRKSKR